MSRPSIPISSANASRQLKYCDLFSNTYGSRSRIMCGTSPPKGRSPAANSSNSGILISDQSLNCPPGCFKHVWRNDDQIIRFIDETAESVAARNPSGKILPGSRQAAPRRNEVVSDNGAFWPLLRPALCLPPCRCPNCTWPLSRPSRALRQEGAPLDAEYLGASTSTRRPSAVKNQTDAQRALSSGLAHDPIAVVVHGHTPQRSRPRP